MKNLITIMLLALVTSSAFAARNFLCSGKYLGKSIVLNGSVTDLIDPRSGSGRVAVDGREVAGFEGADAKVNYIFLTFKAQNSRGELLEGKVIDLQSGSALITRLKVPGFGIDYANIPVTCVEI